MKGEWLCQGSACDLIVVLSGWAVGAEPFRHLRGAADVLVLWDWRDLTLPVMASGRYGAVDLLGYSFGVGAMASLAPQIAARWGPLRRRVAVCGSWRPCDDERGLPRAQVAAMAEALDAAALARFARRAGVALPGGEIAALRHELRAVLGWDARRPPQCDRIILGAQDRIFARPRLERAWQGQDAAIRILPGGHNPFAGMQHWDEVLT